ncbi:MAG: 50S ribosomal protein L25/general stress protein Ctc [Burkholderiaceae bacterium]|nr:50S ribosomal protein L25/general stress protein Ctc [Burkholderiaceae bacterium]MCD8517339.1 50S ribosomal protein L25/general stress protein Ctc [Burkholderiaceae bacterium]MCD8566039.1 50S ribosomal protein L25/general stress protein Ctc [Burkholderiaceae bacterium]
MEFNATSRSVQGSSASRRLRRAGRVPAIVYGGQEPPLNVEVDHNEIYHALRKEQFHASVLDMKLDGTKHSVLLRAVQWHPYKQQVLHIDFQRVDASKVLHTKVPLHFINAEISPAVKLSSAIISHVITELEIECLPANLPQFIEVDLAAVVAGQSIHVNDIKLPVGVKYLPHGGEDNPVVASATVPAAMRGDDAAEGEGKGESSQG